MKFASLALAAFVFGVAAPASASAVSDAARAFVQERLGAMLTSREVVEAVKTQNIRTASLGPADIEALDRRWRSGDAGLIEPTLANDLSAYLADVVAEAGGTFSEIFVMDAKGLNVGQSAKTSDYWQGDEAEWLETYMVGPGAVHVSEVEEDRLNKTYRVRVSMTVSDGGAPIGSLTVGVDLERLE